MTSKPTKTLEDLRASAEPAWLWDAARMRLVWANSAGLAAFGASSLFEMIDHPFDAEDPAFQEMAALLQNLPRDQSQEVALEFPSFGEVKLFQCSCWLHRLSDGRDGVVAVAQPAQTAVEASAFELLPIATLGLDGSGTIVFANEMARRLINAEQVSSLAALLPGGQGETLLQRLKQTKLVSIVTPYTSPFGNREARLTLRRQLGDKPFALAVMEDVTERRALERQLRDVPASAVLAPHEKQAFEDLGRKLQESVVVRPVAVAAKPVVPVVSTPEEKPKAAVIQQVTPERVVLQPVAAAPIVMPPVVKNAPVVVEAALVKTEAARKADQAAKADPAELRSILDISSDGLVMLDAGGHIKTLSAGAEAIFGYRSAEIAGKPFDTLLAPEDAGTVKNYLAGLAGDGLASVFNGGREVTGIVKQGGEVPLFLTIGRLADEAHGHRYCAVLRDITAFKRTENDLRSARDAAEQASRHKSEFLARVSHELRTPLNAIMGFSDIMRLGQYGEVKNEKYRTYLNDIHASGNHLLSMINDLLDLSQIESGKMELNFTSVGIPDCFDHAARLLQEQATRARVLIRKSFPEDMPRVVADQRAMQQVMLNLLSNAIKYTDAGGQVIVSASIDASGSLAMRIKDTGIGMNAAELKKALQPFMRVEAPGRERQGTGLGLPLTKALVEANRASFNISSEQGQGTLVEITFPVTRVLAE